MNLRCIYCQTPLTLARGEMLTAIVQMNDKNMNHYDAHCPRCRRANSISRQRMELFFPNWQEAAKQAPSASASTSPGGGGATQKTEPLPKGLKSAAAIKRPSARPAAKTAKKPAAKKPAATKKTATKAKPAGKKAPARGKKKK
jgi:hypothetical protein